MLSQLEQFAVAERLEQLGRPSDRVWAVGMAVGLLCTLIAAYLFPYPVSASGKFWAYAGLLIRGALYLWAGDALRGRGGETLTRLFKMGLAAGLFELLVDWWLIHGVSSGRLVYLTGNDVVLLGSPVWMPLAWACAIVELGYPALRLLGLYARRWGMIPTLAASSVLCGVGAAVVVGAYEYFAYRAGWWKYEPARAMVGHFCALYILLGEGLMFLTLPLLALPVIGDDERPLAAALVGGARFAVAIAVGYALAYLLLEHGGVCWLMTPH